MNGTRVATSWGHEIIWSNAKKFIAKKLFIRKGETLTEQSHFQTEKTILVESGLLTLITGGRERVMIPGDCWNIRPGMTYQMDAPEGEVVLFEVSSIG